MRPSSGESSSQYGVRILTVVEEGRVDCVPVVALSRKVAGPSQHPLGNGKKKVSRSLAKLPRQFEVSSTCASSRKRAMVGDLTFASVLTSQLDI